jgi:tetratricopeptide (TPR) repeat protein
LAQHGKRRTWRGAWRVLAPAVIGLCASHAPSAAAEETRTCEPVVARIVSLQGSVELRRGAQQPWQRITRLDTPVCQGDVIHAGSKSRAALVILPEKFVRLDQNSTLSISMTGTGADEETVVEFFQDERRPKAELGTACGAGYFITRFPRKFKVRTQFLNAAVEGTEFLVSMSCSTAAVAVYEGKVSAQATSASAEPLLLQTGQMVSAGPGEAPAIRVLVKPVDAVQWALYYPPLSEAGPDTAPDRACEQAAPEQRSRCLTVRAEERLRLGRVDEAQADIEAALLLTPDNADADALSAVINVVKNDRAAALRLAQRATQLDPSSARAWIALSYAQQAAFDLEQALSSAERAAELSPRSATVQSRVAELLMSLGRVKSAERAARAAVDANPSESRAHTILGFVHLAQLDTRTARSDFAEAIAHDSSDPLPRLGLGLAIIRGGDLKAGREQIEIAVALDPTNALIRSYAGKAYYEENTPERDRLAETQFELAKQLDPNDPTPWLYDAIVKQTQNRPVEALERLEHSTELNDNRAAYRSRLLLDQDLAARAVGLSVLYRDLGLSSRALAEATYSLDLDPANFSAHRFLAESYSFLPRHDIAQVSELLQSQLLQPLNVNPVPPRLAESDLLGLTNGAPSDPSFNEYSSLFLKDGARVQLNAIGGTQGTWGDDLLVSALKGPLSLGAGQFHYETDGWRPNSDYVDDLYNAYAQLALSDQTSVQVELRTRRLEDGDISMRLTEPEFSPTFRRSVDTDTARLGLHQKLWPGAELLASVIHQERTERQHQQSGSVEEIPFVGTITRTTVTDVDRNDRGTTGELQLLSPVGATKLVAGAGYTETDGQLSTLENTHAVFDFLFPFPSPPPLDIPNQSRRDTGVNQHNAYVYTLNRLHRSLIATVGVSADWYKDLTVEREQYNPKFGLVWTPTAATQVRAAAFRVLKRALIADQTIEPTQVAGFNQFFDDPNGTDSERIGVGIDHRFTAKLFAGLEASQRRLNVPRLIGNTPREEDQTEHLYRASAGFMPWSKLALNAQLVLEQLEIDPLVVDVTRPTQVNTTRLPVEARLFPNERWSFFLQLINVWQEVETQDTLGATTKTREEFSPVNAGVSYRLPQRRGTVSLQVNNLFDQDFQYQDMNFRSSVPRLPEFLPERSVFVRVNLAFP